MLQEGKSEGEERFQEGNSKGRGGFRRLTDMGGSRLGEASGG